MKRGENFFQRKLIKREKAIKKLLLGLVTAGSGRIFAKVFHGIRARAELQNPYTFDTTSS